MSHHSVTWALNQECSSTGQKLVLVILAEHTRGPADEELEGLCWPSIEKVAARAGIAERQTRAHIESLCEAGFVEKVERRRRHDGSLGTWVYRVGPTLQSSATLDDPYRQSTAIPSGSQPPLDHRQSTAALEPVITEPSDEPSSSCSPGDDEAFELFWATYRRTGPKKKARECWLKARKKATAEDIQSGLEAWIAYWDMPNSANIKWPQGWLSEERWNDEPPWPNNRKPDNYSRNAGMQRLMEIARDAR